MSNDNKDKKSAVSRRDFIRSAAAVTAGATVASAAGADVYKRILPQTVLGANDKIYTGHIGIGGMGRADLGFVLRRDDIQPIALCDLYTKNLERAGAMCKQRYPDFTSHRDFREVIENKDVDAVVIATPDHWHCLTTLHAADAGKHIYCEKPCATTILEGRTMVKKVKEAQEKHGIVFQAGNMQRSGEHFKEAVRLVQEGYIGKVARVENFINDDEKLAGIGMGKTDLSEFPGCDWDFHQGWVEHQPFNTNRWIYNFRWFLDYSGGKITDWGAHLVDIALWGMGEEKKPKTVTAAGGKFLMEDNRTTPDTLDVLWEFDDYVMSFSNRVWSDYIPPGYQAHGTIFHGTLGSLRVDRSGFEVFPTSNNGGCEPKKMGTGQLNELHWENFAQAVRGKEEVASSIDVIHNTTTTCHLGTCAYVAGAKLHWNAEEEKFHGGEEAATQKANDWANRPYLNGWSLEAPYDKTGHTVKEA